MDKLHPHSCKPCQTATVDPLIYPSTNQPWKLMPPHFSCDILQETGNLCMPGICANCLSLLYVYLYMLYLYCTRTVDTAVFNLVLQILLIMNARNASATWCYRGKAVDRLLHAYLACNVAFSCKVMPKCSSKVATLTCATRGHIQGIHDD